MVYDFVIIILKIGFILFFIGFCSRLRNVEFNRIFDTLLVSLPAALLGGRIYHVLINIDKYKVNILDMLNINKGGFDIAGIILGAFLGAWLYIVYKKYSLLEFLDIIAPALVLGDMVFNFLFLDFAVNILMFIILLFITKAIQKRGFVIASYIILIFVVKII